MTEHVKMPDITPLVRYVADGTQTIFSYPFPIFNTNDLAIYIDGAKQTGGYLVSGEGVTEGGDVTFETAPQSNALITLSRELSIERISDYLEGGEFSASSINTELDYIVASLQQVSRAQEAMIRYNDHEVPAGIELPAKDIRQNKALGFDGSGNPIAVSLEGSMAAPNFTANGVGAIVRTSNDKLSDRVSIRDFGAVGDGVADDTNAFINALAASDAVFVPAGEYRTTSTITLTNNQSLCGEGDASIIKCHSTGFHAVDFHGSYAKLSDVRIEKGRTAIRFIGTDGDCAYNVVENVTANTPRTGLEMTGNSTLNFPCHHNSVRNVRIIKPSTYGLFITGGGVTETPSANDFTNIKIYAEEDSVAFAGLYVHQAQEYNSFVNCLIDLDGSRITHCVRVAGAAHKTTFANITTNSGDEVNNVTLDNGSTGTVIINLNALGNGAVINDHSGGNYQAFNAGDDVKNALKKSVVTDLKSTLQRHDIEVVSDDGTYNLDISHTVHMVDATSGALDVVLPAASASEAAVIMIKKTDDTDNIVSISESGGNGPDGKVMQLGSQNDYMSVISDGTTWLITSSNRMSGSTRYANESGTYDIDMTADTYILSSYGGAMIARLPPASASNAVGRTITLKKSDSSSNTITVTEQGGNGPDQASQILAAQYKAVTVVSDGGQWFVVNKL